MLQNIIINKSGSESDDGQKILFSSPTSWEPAGENLIVYKNNQIITNYTVIDANTIKLATKAVVSDNFQLVITQIIDPSGLYSEDDRMHQVDAIYKKMQGKAKTSIQKRYTEETLASNLHMHSQDIWVSPIVVDPQQAANQSVATLHTLSLLAEDLTVPNHLGWNSNITDWIPPRYGKSYIVRIYDRNGAEIPSSDPMGWDFDYQAGYLSIKNSFTYATPLKITGYQYVGKYGVGELTNWKDPVFDIKSMPLLNNLDGDLRLVLDENRIYRFDGGLNKWDKLEYGSDRFKDPVATKSLLPAQAITGDITLVLDENNLYVWADQWLLLTGRSFSPDDYYEK
jgi:hypothetical protein